MKRFYIFCLLLLLFALPLTSATITKTITFEKSNLVFSQVDGYDVIELKGYPALINPGAPRVPRVVIPLVIPAGTKPTKVEIISQDIVELSGTYNIIPAHPDIPLPMPGKVFTPEEILPDPVIYSSNKLYPDAGLKLNGAGSKCGYRIAHIEIFPVRYNPKEGVVQFTRSITYRLEYEMDRHQSTVPTERQKELFGEEVRAIVANPEDVTAFAPLVAKGPSPSLVPPGNYEYVVISEDPMDTVFQRLADWKTKKGIPATVVKVSYINSNYTGYDLQEKVRNFVIDAYNTWGTVYVLLGGSADYNSSGQNIVPTRKAWYVNVGGPDGDKLPSDLYYSDLDGTWDSNNNHIYGETGDNVDMYADVYVGRASVYTISMAQNFVYKILTYEKNPPTDYIKKLMLPTGILWSSYEERPIQDSIADMTPAGWFDAKMYERNGNLSRPGMIDSMNVGYGMGHWEGHGNESGIYYGGGSTPFLTSSDADNLVNGDKEGIANSIACMCGGWDLVSSGQDCFAEHLVNRVGGGLCAVMMNSRYGWGAYVGGGYVPGPSERIDTTFYYNIFYNSLYHIGETHAVAKDAWIPYVGQGQQYDKTRWCIYELNLFGCPEMSIWTDTPATMSVTHNAIIPLGTNDFDVTVKENDNVTPIANALVCLMGNTDTGLYGTGYTNGSGVATITITATVPYDTVWVTVTAQNHYPYEGFALVNTGPYCIYDSHTIDDNTGGNGDGIISPFEIIYMPVTLKNIGIETAVNVNATLRFEVANPYITFIDTVSAFGNIAPDGLKEGVPPYSFSVGGNCPNGDTIRFEIEITDNGGNDWFQNFFEVVWSPELTYEGFVIDDAGQIEPNGILNAGETVDGVISLKNGNAYAHATGLTGILRTSDSYITVTDSTANFPDISPGSTVDNGANPFVLEASSSLPFNHTVDMELYVIGDNYENTFYFSFVAGEKTEHDPTGPDDYAYWAYDMTDTLYTECPTYGWIEIDPNHGGTGTQLVLGDDETKQLELPFDFVYYGDNYDTVSVCSNGWLAMGVTNDTSFRYYPVPHSNGPPASVGIFWGRLDPSASGEIYYKYDATLHIFIVEWSRVYHNPTGDLETFEAVLYDPVYNPTVTGDGEIFCQYLDINYPANSFTGIENEAETIGLLYQISNTYEPGSTPLSDAFVMKFTTDPPEYLGIVESEGTLEPKVFGLSQGYPNPFYGRTKLSYQIPTGLMTRAQLKVYDVTGKLVRTLIDEECGPGWYSTYWDGKDRSGRKVSSGVYFARFTAGSYVKTGKLLILR